MFNFSVFLSEGFYNFLTKITFLTLDLLVTVFLFVAFKQVLSMNTVIEDTNDALILKLASFVLLVLALSLFLTGIVIL